MRIKSRTEYSLINIIAGIGGYSVNLIMSFICRVVFTHTLGAEYLGVNGLFSNILSMLSLTELGIGTAMIYALYKPVAEKNENKISAYMKIYGKAYKIVGVVVAVLGLAIIPLLPVIINETPNITENIYTIYLLYLFSTSSSYFFSYRSSIIIANQRNYVVVTISYVLVVIQNIAQIISLITIHSYLLYLIIQVVFVLLTNILISKKAVNDYPYINNRKTESLTKQEQKNLLVNIKAITVTKLSGILVNNTDNIVITYFNGLITTGIVSNYSLITSMLEALVNQVFTSITASVGNFNAIESEGQKYKVFKALNLANFWIYGWVTIGFVVLANDIIEIIFGFEYVLDISVSIILALNFYMLGMQCVIGIYKSTMGLFRYGQYMLLLTACLNLVGDIVFGKRFGILGIFCATAVARLFTNTWYEPFVVYRYGLNKDFRLYLCRYLKFFLTLVLGVTICFKLCRLIELPLIVAFCVKFIICIIIPNLLFYFVFHSWDEFEYLVDWLIRIKRKILKSRQSA